MYRVAVVLAIVAALTLGAGASAAPPPKESPLALSPTAARSPELAAMVLRPSDMPNPGFGLESSSRYGLDSQRGSRYATLRNAGFVGGYQNWLGWSETGSQPPDIRISSALDEFKDADGAGVGFKTFTRFTNPDFHVVAGTRTFGDKSRLFRGHHSATSTRRADQALTLVFQLGNLDATIYIRDYTGHQPDIATIETLGEKLLARITAGLAGSAPGLSNRVVPLAVDVHLTDNDAYWRLGGQELPRFGDTPTDTAMWGAVYAGATDIYVLAQETSDAKAAPSAVWRAVTFPDARSAQAFVERYIPMSQTGPGAWTDVKSLPDAARFGDHSQTAAYRAPAGAGRPARTVDGIAIVASFGRTAVVLRIQAFQPVPVSIAEGLMRSEADCVRATSPCPRVPVPAALAALANVGGTPAP